MSIFSQLLKNQVFSCSAAGWFIAQLLKTIIDTWSTGSFKMERLYGNGGMPSSHSATVCALVTSTVYVYGLSSFEFAISFFFALVVMVDAMGVRRETGKQAQLLNMMMEEDFWNFDDPRAFEMRFKELIGHTPLQVMAGAILGIIVAVAAEILFYRI